MWGRLNNLSIVDFSWLHCFICGVCLFRSYCLIALCLIALCLILSCISVNRSNFRLGGVSRGRCLASHINLTIWRDSNFMGDFTSIIWVDIGDQIIAAILRLFFLNLGNIIAIKWVLSSEKFIDFGEVGISSILLFWNSSIISRWGINLHKTHNINLIVGANRYRILTLLVILIFIYNVIVEIIAITLSSRILHIVAVHIIA